MDIPKTLFATMIKNARMNLHWTQEELAEKLNVSASYLGDLERHKYNPSLALFCRTIRLLNLSADDYVYCTENANNSTYQKLLRLLTQCNEQQLQVLLATANALLQPAQESENHTSD
jgi:transcriptional regulator with XRE-family HTH domain